MGVPVSSKSYSAPSGVLKYDAINVNRLLDVLQLLLAPVFESKIEAVADVIAHRS